ncbi:M15 family metallopeptidase [Treponema sp.]|uniref:M15 family metallopeptidase n=1 Tax=Treponema sp. TaxID=166 RepID=UPI003F0E29AC
MKKITVIIFSVLIIFCVCAIALCSISKRKSQAAIASGFYIEKFTRKSDIFTRIKGKSFKDDCTLPVSDLRYVHALCKSKDGTTHHGEMVCNKYIAESLLEIFRELYNADYPIEKMILIDEYDTDDEKSMRANNSSCFNFRFITHTKRVSKHGLGMAVDINPLYNPFVKEIGGELVIEPATAVPYTDRTADFDYKIDENDLAYKLFTERGFEWGGSWEELKDYQHFEVPTEIIEKLYPQK